LRTENGLVRALAAIDEMARDVGERPLGDGGAFDMVRLDWFDLRSMRLVAECVARAALGREESRGAHQREDFPEAEQAWQRHQRIRLSRGQLRVES
jgi:succinate dehydrogenase/fumarate reductase flavoprotein subunit